MAFWVYMLVMTLLIPLILEGAGFLLEKYPPKSINWAYGYRTRRSCKNKETWAFAQVYCGRLWQRMGWPLFLCTLVIMLFLRGQGEAVTGTVGAALVGIQIGFMLLSIVFTERALKKNFDGNGEPTSH